MIIISYLSKIVNIFMYIKMYISMYIIIFISMFISMYISINIDMYISMYISINIDIIIEQKKNRLHQRYDLTPKDFSVFIDTYFLSIVSSYSLLSTTATFNINLSYSSLTTNLRVWCFSRSILDLRSVK